ncbi:MAG: replicative DNA helicase [Spirochaetales bacterium]
MENTRSIGRILPHDEEAEKATLGAVLLSADTDTLATVIQYLREDDFYKSAHQRIYRGILNLFNRGESIDLITLTKELRTTGDLEAAGGPAYISSLTSEVPSSANIEYYARIVQEASIRRNLIRISQEIHAESYNEGKDARVIIEEAERKIFEISDTHQSGTYVRAGDIIAETIEAIEKLYHTHESYTGIPSGFPALDNMLSGFQKSEFIVIGARPSVGKTALALSMAANIAVRQNRPVGFFTLEMSRMALMQRLVSSEARISSQVLRTGMLKPADFSNLTTAAGLIYEAPLYISDIPNIKLLDLRAQARRMKSHHHVEIIFIDYLTLIQAENQDLPRHEQIAEISRSLKALARELDIPVVALSQVRRETEGKTPTLADLRESGSIEQDADVVIFLHRERMNDREMEEIPKVIKTQLVVAKQRNGPTGGIEVAFLPAYTRFETLAENT